jgi:hypothetical protein
MRKRNLAIVIVAALALARSIHAQPVVVTGTGDPNIDVPAVQAAVDQGSQVMLTGQFSFDRPPTTPSGETISRTVTLSKEVAISGGRDANGQMPTIEGGFTPFFVQAQGRRISIEGLRFSGSKAAAIWIFAAGGLAIENCRFEGVVPVAGFGAVGGNLAFAIFVSGAPATAINPGHPEYFSGNMTIRNNDIDIGGMATENTVGIAFFNVGTFPNSEVDLYISGNSLRNLTERVIDINSIAGRVRIERNVIATGAVSGPSNGVQPDVIHAVGAGSYLIAGNTIVSEWATGAGIRVQGSVAAPQAGAVVVDNDITMVAPDDTAFGSNSAAIEIRGAAKANTVLNNRIRGRGRAALAEINQNATPANNTFVSNDLAGFQSSLADVFVDSGVTATVIVGRPTSIQDNGTGAVIVPMP